MVPDPRDPMCCQAPKCNNVNVTGVTGAITGIGTTPMPTPGPLGGRKGFDYSLY